MLFCFPQREKKEDFLVLDIGTEAVKILIFEKKRKEIILSTGSLEYFDSYNLFDSKNFEVDIIKKAVSKTLQDLKAKRPPENILLGLPANILKGRIVFHSFRRKNSKEPIEKKEADLICKEVLIETQKKVSEFIVEESGILPKDIHFTDLEILEIKIDGYQVPDLQGYSGENLVFRILAIFLPKDYLKSIESIVRFFNFKNIKILHLAEGLLKVNPVRNFIFKGTTNYLDAKISNGVNLTGGENSIFLDIGGKNGQIFLIKDAKLEQIDEFEVGGSSFSQGLSETLGIKERDARELKERYSKKLLSIEVKNRVSEILARPQIDWYKNLKSKIKAINPGGLLSSTFFLFGGGSILPEIQEILGEGDWQDIRFTEEPKVKFLYPKDLYPSVSLKEEKLSSLILNNPQYTPSFLIYYAR